MLRRILSPLFSSRRDSGPRIIEIRTTTNPIDFRIGWWPIIVDRDQALINALTSGQFQLMTSTLSDHEWAYVAVSVGPYHSEVLRWHFPTSRWYRMPKVRNENENDWCINWRTPELRPPDDVVSGVAQGPFRARHAIAGEMNSNDHLAAVVVRMTRRNDTPIWSKHIFGLVVISYYGMNKQGYLLSPSPEDGDKIDTSIAYHVAYRAENHELHFFACHAKEKMVVWYKYRKRGRRVYWLDAKSQIELPNALSNFHAVREGDRFKLIDMIDQMSLDFDLDHQQWQITDSDIQDHDFLQSTGRWSDLDPSAADCAMTVPILKTYHSPYTLRILSAKIILRYTHPRLINDPIAFMSSLPSNRFVSQTIQEFMFKE